MGSKTNSGDINFAIMLKVSKTTLNQLNILYSLLNTLYSFDKLVI